MLRKKFRIRRQVIPYILIGLRFLTVIWPQSGYIHPDEFFQSAEIVAGDIFDIEVFRSWEFNSTFPIRSIAFPYIFCGIPFLILKILNTVLYFPPLSAYFLLVFPRLAFTAFSVLIDIYLKKLCILFKREYTPVLLIYSTSYVTLTYLTRTLSNTIESVLFAALLFYVSQSIVEITNASETTKSVVNPHATTISCLTVAGFFNRPTFLFYAFAPLMFWLQYGPSHTMIRKLRYRLNSLLPGSIVTGLMFATCDTAYYKGIPVTTNEIFTTDVFENLVLTPWNFIKYNLNSDNLIQHGLHPFWLHTVINIPILFGYLGIIGYMKYWKLMFDILATGMIRVNIIRALFSCSFILPLLLLSLFEHQEARFLIPAIFPLVYLHGSRIWGKKWTSMSRFVWLIYNFNLFYFYGFLHQSGIVRAAMNLPYDVELMPESHELTFIFYHTYMVPKHLFYLPFTTTLVTATHFGSSADFMELRREIRDTYRFDPHSQIYCLMPAPISKRIPDSFHGAYDMTLVTQYGPHFTTEDLPVLHFSTNETTWYQVMYEFGSMLYLDVWHLTIK